jgi:hypothetical protein
MKKLTTEEFILKAKKVHGDKYDYSKVKCTNTTTKVTITCPIHGEFKQTPKMHMKEQGCPICGKLKQIKNKTYTNEEFIKKANQIHNNKYNYNKCEYKIGTKKLIITCKIHGDFFQTGASHLTGVGCKKCGYESHIKNTEYFIQKAKKVHGDKYDYSKVNYITIKHKVTITCPLHGDFIQNANSHLNGSKCPACAIENRSNILRKSNKKFINQCTNIHNNKYDYSKTNYINSCTKVIIKCPTHGEFTQTPNSHLCGYGCPYCKKESVGERIINNWLIRHHITFIRQAKFNDCIGLKNRKLPFDFYLPSPYNLIIEYDGKQHFEPTYTQKIFEQTKTNDTIKTAYCLEKNIDLIRISYKEFSKIRKILSDNFLLNTNLLSILS